MGEATETEIKSTETEIKSTVRGIAKLILPRPHRPRYPKRQGARPIRSFTRRPDLKIGICGKYGGDPTSVMFCHEIGLSYVSGSPRRVTVTKLAAAQAALAGKSIAGDVTLIKPF